MDSIYNEDCLSENQGEGMNRLPENSVDMVLCDLPYGVTKNKWDTPIDLTRLWKEYNRVLKPNGAVVLFGQGKFTATLMLSNPNHHRYNLIWEKDRPSGFLNAKRMPLRSHEDILVFYRKLPTYNPQFWEGKPLHGMGSSFRNKDLGNNNYGEFASRTNPSAEREGDTKKHPRSVLRFSRPHPPIFPTQKPVDLCEWLIRTNSNEGETVLDNCMGSASTALAALNCGRHYVGFEKDKATYELAISRL